MTAEILFMLLLIALALVIFALEWLPIEVTAMSLLAVLVLIGFVTPEQALAGLNNKAVVTIGALFIVSRALMKTGVLEVGSFWLWRRVGTRKWLGVTILLLCAGILSGFLNNTAVVVVFIPLALNLCRRFDLNPSKVLLPLSYASILGGMLTVIGTSTNLLVSSLAEAGGEKALRMFEFTHVGVVLLIVGMAYSVIAGRKFLPNRVHSESLTANYEMAGYLTEVTVGPDSKLIEKTCQESHIRERYGVTVLSIIRGGNRKLTNIGRTPLLEEDILILDGAIEDVLRMRNEQKLELVGDFELDDEEISRQGQVVMEGLIPATSDLIGNTLKSLDFRQHFGGLVVAIRRHGETLHERLADTPLKVSDSLLMVVNPDRLKEFLHSPDLLLISEADLELHRERFWWLPLVLLPAIVAATVTGLVDIMTGALLSAVLLLLLGALKPREAYHSIDWSVIFLIAAFVPVGNAMVATGAAEYLASLIIDVSDFFSGDWKAFLTLALFYLVTSLITQAVSNNAAAIILTPVALSLAHAEGIEPHAFLIAICFAASAAFATPMGYQTNLMVYSPGGYKFSDYVRFGGPLTLITWILASLLISLFWL